ncbi:ubiquitin hydrolase L3 [Irpex rosettiformis]|uniref:Ubiquitin hydrolase L3 n=1 Tax=Irpex rosettiformis TaxID=378272 RepID=A0ACB8UEE1_9APHY|nr:ubiquitin hydrolase L3 [Irpex rosettiformis]
MARLPHRKYFLPLESNPAVFDQLMYELGVSSKLSFCDVLSIDAQEILKSIPRPVHAFVLVFPTSADYESLRLEKSIGKPAYDGSGEQEDVIWFKQTIGNACGLYGLLHAVANGKARCCIGENTILGRLLKDCTSRAPDDRALILENSSELEAAHTSAAVKGDTAPPDNAEDEVDFHYVAFVRSLKNGHLYEMDGDNWGPFDLGVSLGDDEDLLTESVLEVVRAFIRRNENDKGGFGLMALVEGR